MVKHEHAGNDRSKQQEKQQKTPSAGAVSKHDWNNEVLLVEPCRELMDTVKRVIAPKEKCRIRLFMDGYDAITALEDSLQKGRSVDAVIIDRWPSMSVGDFLDMLEKAMIRVNTVVKTMTVIPLYNADYEIKEINRRIEAFRTAHDKAGSVPRLVVSRPKNKYKMYVYFTNVVRRTLREVEAARVALELRLSNLGDKGMGETKE